MSKKPRDNRPYLPPIRKIELSEGNIRLRWILVAVLLAVAILAFGYGLSTMMNTQPGWQEVDVLSDQPNCSSSFKLMYDFSSYGGNASVENKRLIEVYSRACEEAFQTFSPDVEGQGNLNWLNRHVNQRVTVSPTLYHALELLVQYNNRCIFLAPVYAEYNRVFLCETDGEAAIYDPRRSPETGEYVQMLMHYVSDPEHVRLELSADNQATLSVSDAYLSFAEEYGIESFLDFGWMQNAFIADYLARMLEQEGFQKGYLSSYDGFTRNLDPEGQPFSMQIFDRQENTLYVPAEITYTGRRSIVFLRDFPVNDLDRWHYYVYEDGQISSILLNPETGSGAVSVSSLLSLSEEMSCSQLLMEMIPVFLAEGEASGIADSLQSSNFQSIWCKDGKIFYNHASAEPKLLDVGVKNGYSVHFAG